MNRFFLKKAFVCLFTVVALCSCNKDDDDDQPTSTLADNTITAIVENGSSYNDKIDSVKAVMFSDYDFAVASSAYSNGGFTLKLLETVSDTYLEAFAADEFPDGITVSNPNVKIEELVILPYKSGKRTGDFDYRTPDESYSASCVYSNGDVSITGSFTEIDEYDYNGDNDYDDEYEYYETEIVKYNVHLKKGWNVIYGKETDKGNNVYEYEETTQKPSVTLKWYAEVWGSSSSVQGVRSKKVPSLFSKSKIRF